MPPIPTPVTPHRTRAECVAAAGAVLAELRRQRAEMPAPISFFGHAQLPDGKLVLLGQGSMMAVTQDGGAHFTLVRLPGRATLMDMVLREDGTGWLASDAGLIAYSPFAPTEAPTASGAQP
mgnify:CR=1 FL=1